MSADLPTFSVGKARVIRVIEGLGLEIFVPAIRLVTGDDPKTQVKDLCRSIGVPVLSIGVFLLLWSSLAASVETSIGSLPGPTAVWTEAKGLVAEHYAERQKAVEFDQRMVVLKEKWEAKGKL